MHKQNQTKQQNQTQKETQMSKKQNMPELLPITEKGKVEYVKQSDYCEKRSAQLAKELKFKFNKQHISSMLATIANGRPLEDDAPDEVAEAFDAVKSDVDDARNKAAQEAAETEAQQKAADKAKEEKMNNERALITRAEAIDPMMVVGMIGNKFDMGKMDRCIPRDDAKVTNDDLVAMLMFGMQTDNWSQWAVGDVANALKERGLEDVAMTIGEKAGRAASRIYAYMSTAAAVPPDEREGLPYSSFEVIHTTNLKETPKANQKARVDLLNKAKKNGWTKEDIKREIKLIKGDIKQADGDVVPQRAPKQEDKIEEVPSKAVAVPARFVTISEDGTIQQQDSTPKLAEFPGYVLRVKVSGGEILIDIYDPETKKWGEVEVAEEPEAVQEELPFEVEKEKPKAAKKGAKKGKK